MKRHLLFIFLLTFLISHSQNNNSLKPMTVYLIPGQGFDHRVFNNIKFPEGYDTVHIKLTLPPRKCNLKQYAKIIAQQIDTTKPFSLIGVSLGGMICSELCEFLHPQKVILISSAKKRSELPVKIRMLRYFVINRIIPACFYKPGALLFQPIVEPDTKNGKKLFKAMLKAKSGRYLKPTTTMIANWDKKTASEKIIHIHGDADHTLPLKNIKANYIIKKGSHMMIYTRAEEINKILNEVLVK